MKFNVLQALLHLLSIINAASLVSDEPEKIDGKWGLWSSWSNCPLTCGESTQHRTRLCNSPKPENGGGNCSTEVLGGSETRPCYESPCPG